MPDINSKIDAIDATVTKSTQLVSGVIGIVSAIISAVKKSHAGVDPNGDLEAQLAALNTQRDELGAAIAEFKAKYPTA